MPTNNFLTFCPTNTGTNLESQSDYAADSQRTDGNQPGVASSKLNNKALRQANYIASQVAQLIANQTGADVLDTDGGEARLLAQLNATLKPIAPSVQRVGAGSGNLNLTFQFFIASGNATAGATYTNNAVTFTVVSTVAAGVQVAMRGNGAPAVSGTLTKASGSGDATLTFYAVKAPLFLVVEAMGPGGGGAASGITTASSGANGSADTSFGGSLIVAGKGNGAGATVVSGGVGGGFTFTGVTIKLAGVAGSVGGGGQFNSGSSANLAGGQGGCSAYGGSGGSGYGASGGSAAGTESGSGGGGGGIDSTVNAYSGPGGGAGGFFRGQIPITSTFTFAYVVGSGGAGGATPTTGGGAGGAGADGFITMWEHYQ